MGRIESHRDLVAWQKSISLVTLSYEIARTFPSDEKFGLIQQLRRAAVSIPANIAEGKGRGTTNEFIRYLGIASGSLTELDTHFVIAHELGDIDDSTFKEVVGKIEEVGRVITGLRKSLHR